MMPSWRLLCRFRIGPTYVKTAQDGDIGQHAGQRSRARAVELPAHSRIRTHAGADRDERRDAAAMGRRGPADVKRTNSTDGYVEPTDRHNRQRTSSTIRPYSPSSGPSCPCSSVLLQAAFASDGGCAAASAGGRRSRRLLIHRHRQPHTPVPGVIRALLGYFDLLPDERLVGERFFVTGCAQTGSTPHRRRRGGPAAEPPAHWGKVRSVEIAFLQSPPIRIGRRRHPPREDTLRETASRRTTRSRALSPPLRPRRDS